MTQQTRDERIAEREGPDVQVVLKSGARALQFRDLHVRQLRIRDSRLDLLSLTSASQASYISKLVRLPGIVISASVLTSRASKLNITCKACRHVANIPVQGGFSGFTLPRRCAAEALPGEPKDCPLDPYVIVHERCTFVDEQVIKLQEAPDAVPVGELPRHIKLAADRYLTGKVIPGSRIVVTGVYSTFQAGGRNTKGASAVALRTPYLRVLGLEIDSDKSGATHHFTPEEEDEFAAMARSNGFYDRFAESIAPSIYGNPDIKKAVVCLLMGGSKKILPDGMRLRGDINVLLLGDPGTAKSQLLKFVEKVSCGGVGVESNPDCRFRRYPPSQSTHPVKDHLRPVLRPPCSVIRKA